MLKNHLCSEYFEIICSYDSKTKKNQKLSNISVYMSADTNKVDELFACVRIISPVKTRLYEIYKQLKTCIVCVLQIQLKKLN